MNNRSENVWLRRLRNLPHSIKNISRMLWHPLKQLSLLVWNTFLLLIYSVKELGYSILNKVGLLSNETLSSFKGLYYRDKEKNFLILLLCLPASIVFAFKNHKWVKKFFFALIPKLGMFYQHDPTIISCDYSLTKKTSTAAEPLNLVVITPSFEQAEFIKRTIDSVINQGYSNITYIVQDGGSKDGTVEILRGYSEGQIIWESVNDNGQTEALNLGVEKLQDWDIMCYLNSDDLLLPGSINFVIEFFNRHPTVDVVYGNRLMIDEQLSLIHI